MWAGGENRYFINNTIWNADGGIYVPGGNTVVMVNNIIGPPMHPAGKHVFFPSKGVEVRNNLFAGSVRIAIDNKRYDSPAVFAAAGQGRNNILGDPRFVGQETNNYRLRRDSPARQTGIMHSVYATFLKEYGIDILKDITGRPRPRAPAIDLGAYEYEGLTGSTTLRVK